MKGQVLLKKPKLLNVKLIYLFVIFLLCSTAPQIALANSVSIESTEYANAWSPRVPKKVKKDKKKRNPRIRKIKKLQYAGEASWISMAIILLMGILVLAFLNVFIMNIIGAIIIGVALLVFILDFLAFDWDISKTLISFMFAIFNGIPALLMFILGLIFLNPIIWITGLVLLIGMIISLIVVAKY
jgi:hypothetical protein